MFLGRNSFITRKGIDASPAGLFTWGLNSSGQLGLGNTTDYSSPKQVGSLTTWSLANGGMSYASFAIKTDGTLWSWGKNAHGQLGQGDTVNRSSPVQVGALTTWASFTGGRDACMAIKTDGTLWGWGRNANYGQLGLGNLTNYSSPKQVGSLTNWLQVIGSNFNTTALKTDGTLWSWGKNTSGEGGLGNLTNYSSPKQIGALTTWSKLAMCRKGSLAITTGGALWSWGFGNSGQLGLGNTTSYSSPKQVGALTNWSDITEGNYRSFAIKTDGTLWSWGRGSSGALGLGNTTYYSSPKQIGALTGWSKLAKSSSGAGDFMAAIKTNGSLWTWGKNTNGALGLGDITNRSSPVQVGPSLKWTYVSAAYYNQMHAIKTSG